jgi:hypothetical protein
MTEEEAKARFIASLGEVLSLDVSKWESHIYLESVQYYWKAAHFAFQVMVRGLEDAEAMEQALEADEFKSAISSIYGKGQETDMPVSIQSSDVYISEVHTNNMVITHHSQKEFYKQHLCNYNKHSANKCECVCWGDRFYDETSIVGDQALAPDTIDTSEMGLSDNRLDTQCQYVGFPEVIADAHHEIQDSHHKQFSSDAVATPVKVITNTVFGNGMLRFEPVTTWVAHTTTFGFKLCIQGSDSFWRTYAEEQSFKEDPIRIQFFAWQHQMPLYQTYAPKSVQNGRELVASSWTQNLTSTKVKGQTKCIVVKFDHPYAERPLITGSMERVPVHGTTASQAMATTWVERVEKTHFTVCAFREAAEVSDDDKKEVANLRAAMREAADSERFMEAANIQKTLEARQNVIDGVDEEAIMFTWFSFPWWKRQLPRFIAGVGHVKADPFHHDASALDQADDLWVTCKPVRFNHTYDRIPSVIATANHQDHAKFHAGMYMKDGKWNVKSAKPDNKPVTTYVRDVSVRGFTVCSRLLDNSGDHSSLHWDYVAFLPMYVPVAYRGKDGGERGDEGRTGEPAYIGGAHPAVAGVAMHSVSPMAGR